MYPQKVYFNKLIGLILFLIFQIYTYIRYIYMDKYSTVLIEQKWQNKTEADRKQMKTLYFIYGFVSLLGFFGIALYLGSQK